MVEMNIYTLFVLALPLIILLVFRLLFFKKKFSPTKLFGDFISLLYFLSLFLGVVYFGLYPESSIYCPSLAAMIFLSLCLVVYFAPLYYFQRRRRLALDVINRDFFKLFCVVMLIGGIFSIAKYAPLAIEVLSGDIRAFRLGRNAGLIDVGSKSLIDTFFAGFATFFGIAQLLGLIVFSSKLFGKWSNIIGIMLLLSSISYVLNAFSFAGRDGVVYWVLSLLINIILVRTLLGGYHVTKLKNILSFSILLLLTTFLLITISRFPSKTVYYIFNYSSHQLVTFNDVYILDPPLYYGDLNFSEIKGIFVDKESLLTRKALFDDYLDQDVIPWRFKFFVGSFLADFGKVGTLLIMASMAFLVFVLLVKKRRLSTNSKVISIDALFLLYLYCQIGFMGVFYFKHMSLNNYMLALIGLSFVLYSFRLIGLKSVVRLK